MGTHLDEHAMSLVEQAADRVGQAHRLTKIAVPVAGVELVGVDPAPRDRREEGHRRRDRRDRAEQRGDRLL